jgi:predicted transcriptional regulator of viral defense system
MFFRNGRIMNNNIKTLGKTSAKLITRLYDLNKVIFSIEDVIRITGLNYFSAGRLISELKKRQIIATLKKGKHIIVPQELGTIKTYLGNWYVVARELVNSKDYYIGFYSAMKYWGMTTQPLVKIFIATTRRQVPPKGLKNKIFFVYVSKKHIWGAKNEWITKTECVNFSDIEKTIVDILAHPEYGGGITEIAKGIWLAKDKINTDRLLKYIEKYNKNAVAKRLAYIYEILDLASNNLLMNLKKHVKKRYDLFDPTIEKKKVDPNQWHLIDNVGKEQIRRIIAE